MKTIISQNYDATLKTPGYSLPSISYWLALLMFMFAINFLNFATVYFTLNKDGASLRMAESVLIGVCHRMPSRSFWFLEVPLGLCSRCTGLYFSAFATAIVLPFSKISHNNKFLSYSFWGLIPLIADGTLEHLGIYAGNNVLRFSTGILFGYSIIAIITRYHNQLYYQLTNRR